MELEDRWVSLCILEETRALRGSGIYSPEWGAQILTLRVHWLSYTTVLLRGGLQIWVAFPCIFDLFFRTVLFSQKNWMENTEKSLHTCAPFHLASCTNRIPPGGPLVIINVPAWTHLHLLKSIVTWSKLWSMHGSLGDSPECLEALQHVPCGGSQSTISENLPRPFCLPWIHSSGEFLKFFDMVCFQVPFALNIIFHPFSFSLYLWPGVSFLWTGNSRILFLICSASLQLLTGRFNII
jgi:hypothetical protein